MTQNVTDSLEFATWPSGPGRMMSIDLIFDQPLGSLGYDVSVCPSFVCNARIVAKPYVVKEKSAIVPIGC